MTDIQTDHSSQAYVGSGKTAVDWERFAAATADLSDADVIASALR